MKIINEFRAITRDWKMKIGISKLMANQLQKYPAWWASNLIFKQLLDNSMAKLNGLKLITNQQNHKNYNSNENGEKWKDNCSK